MQQKVVPRAFIYDRYLIDASGGTLSAVFSLLLQLPSCMEFLRLGSVQLLTCWRAEVQLGVMAVARQVADAARKGARDTNLIGVEAGAAATDSAESVGLVAVGMTITWWSRT